MTDYFETGSTESLHGGATYSAATRRYTIGASIEWDLTNSLAVELDVMYRRMGYTGAVHVFDSANGNFQDSTIDVKGNSWDFPLLLKYRLGHSERMRPYVAAGGVARYAGPVREHGYQTTGSLVSRTSITTPIDTGDPSDLRKRFYPGFVAASGLELHVGRLHLLPEFRYTRWTANISESGGLPRFSSNQAEVLAGLSF